MSSLVGGGWFPVSDYGKMLPTEWSDEVESEADSFFSFFLVDGSFFSLNCPALETGGFDLAPAVVVGLADCAP